MIMSIMRLNNAPDIGNSNAKVNIDMTLSLTVIGAPSYRDFPPFFQKNHQKNQKFLLHHQNNHFLHNHNKIFLRNCIENPQKFPHFLQI